MEANKKEIGVPSPNPLESRFSKMKIFAKLLQILLIEIIDKMKGLPRRVLGRFFFSFAEDMGAALMSIIRLTNYR